MYWLLSNKSQLLIKDKFIYKAILNSIWAYDIQLGYSFQFKYKNITKIAKQIL